MSSKRKAAPAASSNKKTKKQNHHDTNTLPPPILLFQNGKARLTHDFDSPSDSLLWRQKFASQVCVYNCFPCGHLRLLGTVTFPISSKKLKKWPPPNVRQGKATARRPPKTPPLTIPSIAAARKLAQNEIEQDILPNGSSKEARALEIQQLWNPHLSKQNPSVAWPCPYNKEFDLLALEQYDNFVPWKHIYQLKQLPDDMQQVVEAIEDFKDFGDIWSLPLVHAVPFYEGKKNHIQLCIYAHRLAFEVNHLYLSTILDHLDEGSYRVTSPLRSVKVPSQPTFASSEYPRILFDSAIDENDEEDGATDDDSAEVDGITSPAHKYNKNYMGEEIHDDKTISAYSTDGLLKLLENHGTDTTSYDAVADRLEDSFCSPLMLHQKHAISWMMDMEQLDGFGINSLFWEEREFIDGGKYYYSPKLGQMRLDKPASLNGGLLCDEMGLGEYTVCGDASRYL